MISVPIDRIVPLTDARDNFSRLISDIETLSDGLYVLTKGGKPAIALINIKYLEEIMGNKELPATSEKQLATSHKIEEPAPKKPEARSQMPAAPILPRPSFEVPRIPPIPKPEASSPSTGLSSTQLGVNGVNLPPGASLPVASSKLPDASYDVKPTVNPTWTGEEAKTQPVAPSSLASIQNPIPAAPLLKPDASSQLPVAPPAGGLPKIAQFDKPSLPPTPPTPSKPTINPWPIIPPRALSSLAPSQNQNSPLSVSKPVATSQLPEASLPEASYPKMVAPPPPPPPSSLPRIPSSFQTVPVPINGNNEQLEPSSLASSQNQNSPLSVSKPVASSQMPEASLPPPPITTAPAPFANTSSGTPVVTPKPADSITFDQPPTTIPEPGEDLPKESLASSTIATSQNSPAPAPKPEASSPSTGLPSTQLGVNGVNPTPATPPPSVQDLEI